MTARISDLTSALAPVVVGFQHSQTAALTGTPRRAEAESSRGFGRAIRGFAARVLPRREGPWCLGVTAGWDTGQLATAGQAAASLQHREECCKV